MDWWIGGVVELVELVWGLFRHSRAGGNPVNYANRLDSRLEGGFDSRSVHQAARERLRRRDGWRRCSTEPAAVVRRVFEGWIVRPMVANHDTENLW